MLAIAARDRGQVPLCCQILIYPMRDDPTGSTRAAPPFIGTIGWNAQANRFGGSALLDQPAGGARVPPGSVPARAPVLQGLPPTFLGVGAIDLFVDEDIADAQRLAAAGVPVRPQVVPGAYHGFDFIAPASQAARSFADACQRVLRTAFTTA